MSINTDTQLTNIERNQAGSVHCECNNCKQTDSEHHDKQVFHMPHKHIRYTTTSATWLNIHKWHLQCY